MTTLRLSLSLAVGLLLATAACADEARGRIVKIDPDRKHIRLEIRRPVRAMLDLKIDGKTQILIGGQPAALSDLTPGRRIRVVFDPNGGKAVAQVIRSFGLNLLQPPPAAAPAAAPKDGEGVGGTLRRISFVDSEIVVVGPGAKGAETETTIAVPNAAAITRDGKKISLEELKEGEEVTVKTEMRKGTLTAVSIQTGRVAAEAAKPAEAPRRNLIPRLRQALKLADEVLREIEQQRAPLPERP